MKKRTIILIGVLYTFFKSEANGELELPDYEYYRSRHIVNKPTLREKFLERKNNKRTKEMRINMLKKYSSEDTVYLNGIGHTKMNKNLFNWDKINEIELDLKKILAGVGVSYIYKRDHFWRTWKKVIYPKNITKLIFYKYNSIVNTKCKKCDNAGFWNIEEEPPCPLELYSVLNSNQVCGVKYTQLYNYTDDCPVVVNFADVVSSCDNPIKTSYRITRLFKESKSLPTEICGKLDYCEISTFYRIYKKFVLFRVINSSNDIIYSRIMKSGNKNYVCTTNCGQMDSKNLKVINDKPLSVSLLPKRFSKRENSLHKINEHNTTTKKGKEKKVNVTVKMAGKGESEGGTESQNIVSYGEFYKKAMLSIQKSLNNMKAKYFANNVKPVTESTCTRLSKHATTEDYEENNIDYIVDL